jgi:integrase
LGIPSLRGENVRMPKLIRAQPKYRKHKGRAVVTIAGQVRDLGPHGTKASRLEYDRRIAEWLLEGRPSNRKELEPISVVEVIDDYLKHARAYYSKNGKPTSEFDAIRAALRPLNEWYGTTAAEEFGPLALKVIRQRMVDEQGWSRSTLNSNVGRIRRMFKWAASEELVAESTWRALQTVDGLRKGKTTARETAPVLPVAADVVKATLPYLPPAVADMVRLQQLTGCRPAEVCLLRPADINTSGDVWAFVPPTHKTEHHGRARTIFIGPRAQDVLRKYLLRDKETYCFSPRESERERLAMRHEKRVTPLHYGNRPGMRWNRRQRIFNDRYAVDAYRRAIARAVDLANRHRAEEAKATGKVAELLRRWAPNQLRHTKATEIRASFGIDAAATVLGHSRPDTTLIYAERDLERARQIMRAVG